MSTCALRSREGVVPSDRWDTEETDLVCVRAPWLTRASTGPMTGPWASYLCPFHIVGHIVDCQLKQKLPLLTSAVESVSLFEMSLKTVASRLLILTQTVNKYSKVYSLPCCKEPRWV